VPGNRKTDYYVDQARQPFFSPAARSKASQATDRNGELVGAQIVFAGPPQSRYPRSALVD
jgi:hypothetical protein